MSVQAKTRKSAGSSSYEYLNPLKRGLHLRWREGRKSSKRVHDGEAVVLVTRLRYLTDSITRAQEIFPGATQRIGDPIKDSNRLRNRERNQFGMLIGIPRRSYGAAQTNTSPFCAIWRGASG